MKLYDVALSPFSARNRLQIYAKGLDVELASPGRSPSSLKSEEYLALNPMGRLPTLVDGDWSLPESTVIAEYLEDVFPEPALRPEDPKARARMRLLCRLCDLYLFPPLVVLFDQVDPRKRDAERVASAFDELERGLGYVESYLDDGAHAVAAALTLADCHLVPTLFYVEARGRLFGQEDPWLGHEGIGGYWQRVTGDRHAARLVAELGEALRQRMAAGG